MITPVRVGLVGCGRLAEAGYVPAVAHARGVEIVAVADPDSTRRDLVGAALGIAAAARHEGAVSLLARPRTSAESGHSPTSGTSDRGEGPVAVEAVVVASPVATHVEVAGHVAAAGLPCLVEKPPARDAAGARALAALHPAPLVGFNRRFSLGLGLPAGLGRDGEVEIEGTLHYRRSSWDPIGELGDAWLDLGPHLVDLAMLAARRPLAVASATLAERRAVVELEGEGVRARLECATDRPHRERFRVAIGGRPVLDARAGGLPGLLPRPGRPHPLVASLAAQLEAFAVLVRGGEPAGPSPATAAEGVPVMELIDAARRA